MTKRKEKKERDRERERQFLQDKDKEPEIIQSQGRKIPFPENKSNDEFHYYQSTSRGNQHAKENKHSQ